MAVNVDKKLQIIFKKQSAIKSQDLISQIGSRSTLSRWVKENKLKLLGGGYYCLPEADIALSKIAVLAHYYPQGVLVGHNALWLQGVLDGPIDCIEIQIDSKKSLKNVLFNVTRVKSERMVGVVQKKFQGQKINTYPIEKLLCILSKSKKDKRLFQESLTQIQKKEIEIDLDKVKKFDIDLQTSAHKKLSSAAKSKEDIKSPLQANTNVSRDEIVAAGKNCISKRGYNAKAFVKSRRKCTWTWMVSQNTLRAAMNSSKPFARNGFRN